MSKFDLIDDYLTNRLSEGERGEFESGMNADPALRSEVERQQMIVEGIRKARASELKAMLNKVPVGGVSLWSEWSVLKIAATVGVVGVIGTGLYFFLKDSDTVIQHVPSAEIPLDSLLPKADSSEATIESKEEETEPEKKETVTLQKRKAKPKKAESSSPKVDVVDPSDEMLTENQTEETTTSARLGISMSTIQVERDSKNTQYSFHYQFWEGKLFLYGPFDESLYEILEVHGTNPALFLFFKDNFYHLDRIKEDVMPLTPIRDRALTQKLKEFRSGK